MTTEQELTNDVPTGPGTYALLLLATTPQKVQIGRLGVMEVIPGYHVYVGSALAGLRGRLKHHLTPADQIKPTWHVDFIRRVTSLEEIWYTVSQYPWECTWAQVMIALPGSQVPSPKRFGATRCAGKCITHLPFFSKKPSLEAFRSAVNCQVEHLVIHTQSH